MCTFATFRAGFYTGHAYIQDRFMCSSCAIISSIHSAEHAIQHPCVLYMTSHTINSIKSRFCKPWLLFESGLCVGMQLQNMRLLFESGFYSRAAFIQLLYKTLRYCQTLLA